MNSRSGSWRNEGLADLANDLHGPVLTNRRSEAAYAFIFVLRTDAALAFGLIAVVNSEFAALVVIAATPTYFVTGLLGSSPRRPLDFLQPVPERPRPISRDTSKTRRRLDFES